MQNVQLLRELEVAFTKPAKTPVLDLDKIIINRESFNLLRVEDLHDKLNGVIPPYRQSDFFIVFIKKGSGNRTIGQYTFKIEDHTLAIVPQRVIHKATYNSKPHGYFIIFNPDFFLQQAFSYKLLKSRKVLNPSPNHFVKLDEEQAALITNIFETIIKECNSGFNEKKEMIALKVLELLIICDRFFSGNAHCNCEFGYFEILKRFNELIETSFTRHREVQFYAQALHTHPNNLNHLVKKLTGITAKQTITNRLIMEAKYLLASTTISIKEIAYDLGFEDPNYFISLFKKQLQLTPTLYRKQLFI